MMQPTLAENRCLMSHRELLLERIVVGTLQRNEELWGMVPECKHRGLRAASAPEQTGCQPGSTCCYWRQRRWQHSGRCTWCWLGSGGKWRTLCGYPGSLASSDLSV